MTKGSRRNERTRQTTAAQPSRLGSSSSQKFEIEALRTELRTPNDTTWRLVGRRQRSVARPLIGSLSQPLEQRLIGRTLRVRARVFDSSSMCAPLCCCCRVFLLFICFFAFAPLTCRRRSRPALRRGRCRLNSLSARRRGRRRSRSPRLARRFSAIRSRRSHDDARADHVSARGARQVGRSSRCVRAIMTRPRPRPRPRCRRKTKVTSSTSLSSCAILRRSRVR